MTAVPPTPEQSTPGLSPAAPPSTSSSQPSKRQRVLACVLCQQRKVKCDRKFPCINCIKSKVQCVPATLAPRRQRRQRFPERELLDRLRKYEDLLQKNNIKFQPLHKASAGEKGLPNGDGNDDSEDEPLEGDPGWSSPSMSVKSEKVYEAKNLWPSLNQGDQDRDNDDNVGEVVVKKAWDQMFENDDHLLFGSHRTTADLSTLHPEPIQIFRLWQIYLDNVNPLLKVTHTPSLQGRIIEAASKLSSISPPLEALMFSIYCMAIQSLEDCQSTFGSSKEELLTRYRFGCQQALMNAGFLRSSDRDCLTALFLYLVSVGSSTVPRSLSSILGIAIRIAQRMGIHSEIACSRCPPLEAEMRRRLWWSLIHFDTRICEMSHYQVPTLSPTWDCRIPLNVNDSDLRAEMKEPPAVQGISTDALFTVVRSEIGEFINHNMFHLNFTSSASKPVVKDANGHSLGGNLATLEKTIEEKYLKFCDPENPLHFMTIWMTRAYLARCRLVEHFSNFSIPSEHQIEGQTETQRDKAISYALIMLECDTKIITSPLTKGYLWLIQFYFPFFAYLQIFQGLKGHPMGKIVEQAWETMNDNYEARFFSLYKDDSSQKENPLFKLFARTVLQAWEAREAALSQLQSPLIPPRIISDIRHTLAQLGQNGQNPGTEPNSSVGVRNEFPMPIPLDFDSQNLLYSMGWPDDYTGTKMGLYSSLSGQAPGMEMDQLDLTAMDWGFIHAPIAEGAGSAVPWPLH